MSDRAMTEEELLALSDDEIAQMVAPPEMAPAAGAEEGAGGEADEEGADGAEGGDDADGAGNEDGPNAAAGTGSGAGEEEAPGDEAGSQTGEAGNEGVENPLAGADEGPDAAGTKDPEGTAGKADGADKELKDGQQKADGEEGGEKDGEKFGDEGAVDYKAAYEQIMAPFKAAGKTVKLNSPDEVVQLMQMGAHYTKKMQALQPNLKLLRMLENNDLLDEGKLTYLLDLHRKDPAAIQKLVRESGLDPLEMDTSAEPDYRPGNHKVSDEEITFSTTVEEVASDPAGKDLIVAINRTWDAKSKEALWGDPSILRVLADQKSNGIFDQVSSEIERRRTLGYLRNEPFLQAYETVGKEMQAQGALTPKSATNVPAAAATPNGAPNGNAGGQQAGNPAEQRRVVETRPAQRKTVSNSEKAKAASPSKAAPSKKPAADFNPLALSDEDFEKNADLARKL